MAGWFKSLHPSIIASLKRILDAASAASKPAVVCGEMAGSPFYVPILIGLGATELSMNVNSITRVRRVITGIAFDETRDLVGSILSCGTVEDVESTARAFVEEHWSHLFDADQLVGFKPPLIAS